MSTALVASGEEALSMLQVCRACKACYKLRNSLTWIKTTPRGYAAAILFAVRTGSLIKKAICPYCQFKIDEEKRWLETPPGAL